MWIRGTFLILFALLIDAAQIAVAWTFLAVGLGLQLVTPAGGAVGGAAAGAYLCWDTSAGVIAGIVASVKCGIAGATAGAIISAFGVPIGTAMGFIVDICVSLTLGVGLIMALIFCGVFDFKYVWGVFIVKCLPGFCMTPVWTLMVVKCIFKPAVQKGGIVSAAVGIATGAVSPSIKSTVPALGGVKNMQSDIAQPRAANDNFKSTANDNFPSYVQKAA
jgi:hypothetical protein